MTTFEFSILVILCSIVILIIFRSYVIVQEIHDICRPYSRLDSKLQNIVEYLGELTDIVDKMHRNLCVEIADKMVDRVCPSTRTIKVKGQRCELTDEELMKRINEDNKED